MCLQPPLLTPSNPVQIPRAESLLYSKSVSFYVVPGRQLVPFFINKTPKEVEGRRKVKKFKKLNKKKNLRNEP